MSIFAMPVFADHNWEIEKRKILDEIQYYPGWCSSQKAELIMDKLNQEKLELCVEIGTFGGATISVIAKTLKFKQCGTVFAIDPWLNEEAIKGFYPNTPFYEWWSKINLEEIFKQFQQQLKKDQLSNIKIYRMTSQEALGHFQDNSIDFLHIDGNHSENGVFFDVINYYPKVKDGGYILLNDANWIAMRKALVYLLENTDLCTPYFESQPFLLFKKSHRIKSIADQLWR